MAEFKNFQTLLKPIIVLVSANYCNNENLSHNTFNKNNFYIWAIFTFYLQTANSDAELLPKTTVEQKSEQNRETC